MSSRSMASWSRVPGSADAEALARDAVQEHGLSGDSHGAGLGVTEGLLGWFVPVTSHRSRSLAKSGLPRRSSPTRSVRSAAVLAVSAVQANEAGADLAVPIREKVARGGVEEEVAGEVAPFDRPVVVARVQREVAGVRGEEVHAAADGVRGVGAHRLQRKLEAGVHGAAERWRRLGGVADGAGRRRR
jgi:hypothetical protein